MANFGWAYVDCTDTGGGGGGQAAGPTGSLQFLTGANATSGSISLLFHTASTSGYTPNTMLLSGNLIVTGAISASTYHIKDIAVIDATGSTSFGDSADDVHVRTGSLLVAGPTSFGDTTDDVHMRTGSLIVAAAGADGLNPAFSASAPDGWAKVGGFAGRYQALTAVNSSLLPEVHIYGLQRTTVMTLNVPAASTVPAGFFWIIKDEVTSRTGASNNITITSSSPTQNLFDGETTYVLTGTMPAISLYSNGTNWFVF